MFHYFSFSCETLKQSNVPSRCLQTDYIHENKSKYERGMKIPHVPAPATHTLTHLYTMIRPYGSFKVNLFLYDSHEFVLVVLISYPDLDKLQLLSVQHCVFIVAVKLQDWQINCKSLQ